MGAGKVPEELGEEKEMYWPERSGERTVGYQRRTKDSRHDQALLCSQMK